MDKNQTAPVQTETAINDSVLERFKKPFLLPNGKKYAVKRLETEREKFNTIVKMNSEKEERGKKESILAHNEEVKSIERQIEHWRIISNYPIIEAVNQNKVVLPGNGTSIILDGEGKYVVIDGLCVCGHYLPENTMIVSANSRLGEALLGKKVDEIGFYTDNQNKSHKFVIKKIDLPQNSKWVFRNNLKQEEN